MFSRIVIKTLVLSVILMTLVGCGQKGPLTPEPMPEQNTPAEPPAEDTQ